MNGFDRKTLSQYNFIKAGLRFNNSITTTATTATTAARVSLITPSNYENEIILTGSSVTKYVKNGLG
jgi:hypothetical protein